MLLRRTSWSAADDASITPLFSWSYSLPFLLRIRGDDARPAIALDLGPTLERGRPLSSPPTRGSPPSPARRGGPGSAPDPALALDTPRSNPTSARRGMEPSERRRTERTGRYAPRGGPPRVGRAGTTEPRSPPATRPVPRGTRFGTTVTFFADGDYFPAMRFTGPSFGPSKFAGDRKSVDPVNRLGSRCVGIGRRRPDRRPPPTSLPEPCLLFRSRAGAEPDVTPASASILPSAHFALRFIASLFL